MRFCSLYDFYSCYLEPQSSPKNKKGEAYCEGQVCDEKRYLRGRLPYDVISYSTGDGPCKVGALVVSSREHDHLFPD